MLKMMKMKLQVLLTVASPSSFSTVEVMSHRLIVIQSSRTSRVVMSCSQYEEEYDHASSHSSPSHYHHHHPLDSMTVSQVVTMMTMMLAASVPSSSSSFVHRGQLMEVVDRLVVHRI